VKIERERKDHLLIGKKEITSRRLTSSLPFAGIAAVRK